MVEFPSLFYFYFYKDKNKEKGMNCAKAPYRRDMGEMGGNGGYSLPEGSGSEVFIFIFGALRSKDAIKISAPRAARQGPPLQPPPPFRIWGGGRVERGFFFFFLGFCVAKTR